MKILVISDIHENFNNLYIALSYAKKHEITTGFVLGDLVNPGIMHVLGKSSLTFKIVLGNNDGDRYELTKVALGYSTIELADIYLETQVADKKAFLIHYEHLGRLAAKSGDYDAVFCGHTHKASTEGFNEGKTLVGNPGELSGHMYGMSSFGIWDTELNTFSVIKITKGWIDTKIFKRNNYENINSAEFEEVNF